MTTLILGLGNPCCGDDGVGLRVAEYLRPALAGRDDVELDMICAAGVNVMERMVGYDRVVLIDGLRADLPPGTLRCGPLEALPVGSASGSHDLSLPDAVRMGRRLGLPLPQTVTVVAIQIDDANCGSAALSAAVAAAIPRAARRALELIDAGGEPPRARARQPSQEDRHALT